jgi:hypothetical protein
MGSLNDEIMTSESFPLALICILNLKINVTHIMKKILLSVLSICTSLMVFAQNDSITYGPGYSNQVYYSFENGEVQSSSNTAWDLAFGIGGFNTDIRINDGFNVKLYLYPNGDTSAWNSIDTNGLQNWTPRYNSDTNWSVTAFAYPGLNHPDYGWGIYNSVSHNVEGDSIYIIQKKDGSFIKFKMNGMLTTGEFTFTYANIDGSNEVNGTVNKLAYTGKNFAYYSLDNDSVMDLEPANTDWDILFTKYMQAQPQGGFYPVTGVLANKDRQIGEARGIPVADADWYQTNYTSNIGEIGSDWKYFDMTTYTYKMTDSLSYFFADSSNNVWHLAFTGFAGSSTGWTYFTKNKVGNLSVEDSPLQVSSLTVYPNPAVDVLNISLKTLEPQNNMLVTVYSMNGTVVYSNRMNFASADAVHIPVSNWNSGMYIVRLGEDQNAIVQTIVVR